MSESNFKTPSFTLPKVKDSQIILDEFIKIQRDSLENGEGHSYPYYTLIVPGPAALVLAKTKDDKFVIIKEYRHPAKKTLLSLPGGYIDPGEDPIEAGKRELLEEVGYSAEKFTLLGTSYPYAGISSQQIHYLLAEGAYPSQAPMCEPCEFIDVEPMTFEAFKEEVRKGYPVDGNLLTAFFWLNLSV